jgi:hypothetical protein
MAIFVCVRLRSFAKVAVSGRISSFVVYGGALLCGYAVADGYAEVWLCWWGRPSGAADAGTTLEAWRSRIMHVSCGFAGCLWGACTGDRIKCLFVLRVDEEDAFVGFLGGFWVRILSIYIFATLLINCIRVGSRSTMLGEERGTSNCI